MRRARAAPETGMTRSSPIACALLLPLLLLACIQADGRRWTPLSSLEKISEHQEREVGMEFDRELGRHVRVIHDPVVTGFINDLGQAIVRQLGEQPYIYRFRIIDDPSLNAFAVPGGYVYFHSGTVLAAGSLDELAGVMGHEIAHVKARHYARMKQKAQIPDLVTNLGSLAVAAATEEPGIATTGQALNVALKLQWSREFEAESDELGSIFVARAGFDPAGSVRFFERILEERDRSPVNLPPYLFSHPEVEERMQAVRETAAGLHPAGAVPDALEDSFHEAQDRLTQLVSIGRSSLPPTAAQADPNLNRELLQKAESLAAEGELDAALEVLEDAARREPRDPRAPFRRAEILTRQGRHLEAIAAYRRTAELDPTRASVFYRLGLAHKAAGQREHAVYALEQAVLRSSPDSSLRKRADWEVGKLSFGVVAESGFADGERGRDADTPAGTPRTQFDGADARIGWWARLTPHFLPYADEIVVRWRDPSGRVVQEQTARSTGRVYVSSVLDRRKVGLGSSGEWTVEVLLRDDPVGQSRVRVES